MAARVSSTPQAADASLRCLGPADGWNASSARNITITPVVATGQEE
jgi:hypothetical protein